MITLKPSAEIRLFALLLIGLASFEDSAAAQDRVGSVATPADVRYQRMIDEFDADPNRGAEPLRPQYHFTPIDGWFNDPNGLCYFRDRWHLFYQHGGNGWGHAISDDLLHWSHRVPAARPDARGAIWSGSGVVDRDNTSGLFDELPGGYVGIFSYMNPREGRRQSQALIYSDDGETFRKYAGNPVIPQLRFIAGQPDTPKFRDPKVFWHAPTNRWVMAVAGGHLRIFSSPNLIDWTLESVDESINTECPDLFQLPVDGDDEDKRWVLTLSGTNYYLGEFDGRRFMPTSERIRLTGGSNTYASQSFSHAPDGRLVYCNWMKAFDLEKRWPGRRGGSMGLLTRLELRATGDGMRLFQNPIREYERLRGEPVRVDPRPVDGTVRLPVSSRQAEIQVTFDPGTSDRFGVRLFSDGEDHDATIGYDVASGQLYGDRSRCGYTQAENFPLRKSVDVGRLANGEVKLRIFIDHSTLEVFANDGEMMFAFLVGPEAGKDGIELFAEGGTTQLRRGVMYPMRSIWRDEGGDPTSPRLGGDGELVESDGGGN